jgi:chorismate mutase
MSARTPTAPPDQVDRLRAEIERIDRALIGLVGDRVRTARSLAEMKGAAGMPTLDPAQEATVIRRAAALARESGLPEEETRDLFWVLVGLTRRAQGEP